MGCKIEIVDTNAPHPGVRCSVYVKWDEGPATVVWKFFEVGETLTAVNISVQRKVRDWIVAWKERRSEYVVKESPQ